MLFAKIILYLAITTCFIAVIIGIVKFKKAVYEERLFIFVLLLAFTVDFLMGFTSISKRISYTLYDFYGIFETVVFFTYLEYKSYYQKQKLINRSIRTGLIILWLVLHRESWMAFRYFTDINPIYDGIYQVIAAFMSGYGLLLMIEKEKNIFQLSGFYILLAITYNCFANFFLSLFANNPTVKKLWFIFNFDNLICYILVIIAFTKIKKQSPVIAENRV